MKSHNITIDINKLTADQLEQLQTMAYQNGQMNDCHAINERIAFLNGWMSAEREKEYYHKLYE